MPHRPTIERAIRVTASRSLSAPVVITPKDFLLGRHAAQRADNAAA
jgi:hypothetical protein